MSFEVVVLGVGDAFSAVHHPTSFLCLCEGFVLAVDCPDGYRRMLRAASERSRLNIDLSDISAVLLTHVHGDHMNGLEAAAFFRRFVEKRRLALLATRDVRDVIWDERLAGAMRDLGSDGEQCFDDYFDFQELKWEERNTIGPFSVELRRTTHQVPTSALRISAGDRMLGYSADTAFDPELIDWLCNANTVIHETNFGPYHSDYRELARLPLEQREKMRLAHYPDGFDLENSAIRALSEGERFFI